MIIKIAPILLLVLASCTTTRYQVFTMESNLAKDANEEFAYETDSMAVAYSFAASDEDLIMAVYNLSEEPLFINWKNSAYIKNGRSTAMDYYNGKTVEIIPPGAFVLLNVNFHRGRIPEIKKNPSAITYTMKIHESYSATGRKLAISQNESPYTLQTSLQISRSENFENTSFLIHKFWVKEVIETTSSEFLARTIIQNSDPNQGKRHPDKFYISIVEEGNGGQVAGVLLSIVIIWAIIAGNGYAD